MNKKDIIALVILIINIIVLLTHIGSLPDTIPIHFNASGEPDNYGNKNMLWLVAGIAAFIYLMFYSLKGVSPTPKKSGTQLTQQENIYVLESMNISIQMLFLYISFQIIQVSLEQAEGLNVFIMISLLFLVFLPLIMVFIKRGKS